MREQWEERDSDDHFLQVRRAGDNLICSLVVREGPYLSDYESFALPVATLLSSGPTSELLDKGYGRLLGWVARTLGRTSTPWAGRPHRDEIIEAARTNDVEGVRSAIAAGASADTTDASGHAALYLAAYATSTAAALAFLEAGADPSGPGFEQETALHAAARTGNLELVRALLAKGAVVDARTQSGKTPLMMAESIAVVHELVIVGADLGATDHSQRTALDIARWNDNKVMIAALEELCS